MIARIFHSLLTVIILSFVITGCTSDAVTDSLSVHFSSASITTEKQQGKPVIAANMVVRLVNRTERGMNIVFIEGTLFDASTNKALVRFRPIIPDSYGSISTGQLLPKQVKDFSVVTPLGLDGSEAVNSKSVIVKLEVQTTDGYRTEVVSAPTPIASK